MRTKEKVDQGTEALPLDTATEKRKHPNLSLHPHSKALFLVPPMDEAKWKLLIDDSSAPGAVSPWRCKTEPSQGHPAQLPTKRRTFFPFRGKKNPKKPLAS